MTMEALPQDLADFLVTRNFDPEYFDAQGQPSDAGDAKTMKFDYVSGTGKNYGTAVCVIADDELGLFYGDNLGRGMEPEDKDEWYTFLEELSNKAASHSASWSPRDINQLKHTLAGIAAIKEGLFEGYYGNRRVSYMGEQTQARLVINHNRVLGEDDKRYRYVESLFIETADQERFRLPFKSLSGGRAMLEHVRSGGRPYDVRGNHITEVVSEMAVLSRFNRAQHNRVFEGVTQELVESARQYYHNLQETIKHLGSSRGYQAYFESWAPDHIGEAESLVENLRNLFVEQTLDARIEAALPTLAKIQQQGNNMKEAEIFENWINNLSEGTWALPETPEQMEKLNQLMSSELIVGPDATNATEQLYDIVGDDELFDILNDLADKSEGRANCWDDSDVQRRLAELGIQTPQSTEAEPADVDQDTAPEVKEGLAQDEAEEEYGGWRAELVNQINYNTFEVEVTNARSKESANFIIRPVDMVSYGPTLSVETFDVHDLQTGQTQSWTNDDPAPEGPIAYAISALFYDEKPLQKALRNIVDTHNKKGQDKLPGLDQRRSIGQEVGIDDYVDAGEKTQAAMAKMKKGMAEGDNMSTFVESNELARMLKHAGVPIKEGVLTDSTGSTLDHIQNTFKRDVKDFAQSGEMSDALYDVLYDYYFDDMPYGTKKARTGDPHEWVSNRFAQDIGIDENLITPMIMPVNEGSCNMTMEGSYCPEHGLAKCESMYEDSRTARQRTVVAAQERTAPLPHQAVKLNPAGMSQSQIDNRMTSVGFIPGTRDHAAAGEAYRAANPNIKRPVSKPLPRSDIQGTDLDPAAPGVDEDGGAVGMPYSMGEGVYDPDYRGGYNNEFDELEDLLSRSGMSQDDLLRQRFLASKHGLNTPADMAKLPALKKDAEAGYKTRKSEIDADFEKRNQQYLQDKLTDLEYQQDPVAFVKRRTQQLAPTAPTAPTEPTAPTLPTDVAAEPGTDYSLPRAKLGSSPSARLPNFRPDAEAPDSAPVKSDQLDTRNQKSSMFQQLAQLRNRTRGNMAETSNDDPINSNSAMTGSYYEGKETKTQEGDALLARIKSLALLR